MFQSYKKFVNSSSLVLEVGASTTDRTRDLASICRRLIGIEYLPPRLPKSLGNITYKLGDWQHLTEIVKKETIDIVISSHVIEHIPDDKLALNETYKILKPGGIALINTPNRNRLVRKIIEIFTGKRVFSLLGNISVNMIITIWNNFSALLLFITMKLYLSSSVFIPA